MIIQYALLINGYSFSKNHTVYTIPQIFIIDNFNFDFRIIKIKEYLFNQIKNLIMKKILFTISCFITSQVSAQTSLSDVKSRCMNSHANYNSIFTYGLSDKKDGTNFPILNSKQIAQRKTQNKPTGTQYRVIGNYTMDYDGVQYNKVYDSLRFYFSGTNSFRETLGMDLSEYYFYSSLAEDQVPTFPQYFSTYDDLTDSSIYFGLNASGTIYDNLELRILNTLDANGKMTESIRRELSGGVWENSIMETYNHNTNHQITEHISQDWVSGAWENDYKQISTYDANGNLQEFTSLKWLSGTWTNNRNHIYQYDANGNCIVEITRNPNGTSWENGNKFSITYNANHKATQIIYSDWVSGAWIEKQKTSITYNNNNDIVSILGQNKSGSNWIDSDRYTNTYSGNLKTNYLDETFDGTVWVKNQNNIYTYSSSGKLESCISQNWDDVGSTWENAYKSIANYNNLDLIGSIEYQDWNSGGYWDKASIDSFFYESYETTGIHNLKLNEANLSVYPNPTNKILNISISLKQPTNCNLTIIDVSGRIYKMQKMSKAKDIQMQFDISELANGSYFLKVATSDGQVSKGFQVLK